MWSALVVCPLSRDTPRDMQEGHSSRIPPSSGLLAQNGGAWDGGLGRWGWGLGREVGIRLRGWGKATSSTWQQCNKIIRAVRANKNLRQPALESRLQQHLPLWILSDTEGDYHNGGACFVQMPREDVIRNRPIETQPMDSPTHTQKYSLQKHAHRQIVLKQTDDSLKTHNACTQTLHAHPPTQWFSLSLLIPERKRGGARHRQLPNEVDKLGSGGACWWKTNNQRHNRPTASERHNYRGSKGLRNEQLS